VRCPRLKKGGLGVRGGRGKLFDWGAGCGISRWAGLKVLFQLGRGVPLDFRFAVFVIRKNPRGAWSGIRGVGVHWGGSLFLIREVCVEGRYNNWDWSPNKKNGQGDFSKFKEGQKGEFAFVKEWVDVLTEKGCFRIRLGDLGRDRTRLLNCGGQKFLGGIDFFNFQIGGDNGREVGGVGIDWRCYEEAIRVGGGVQGATRWGGPNRLQIGY